MKTISIIVPIYNEERMIELLHEKIIEIISPLKYNFEIIFINDGSKDNSLALLKEINRADESVKIINFSRNFGQQNAIKAGYDHSIGDAVICMDADMQNPPEMLEKMIALWEDGFDIVICKRKGGQKAGFFKDITSRLFYILLNFLSEVRIDPNVPDFRLIDKKVVKALHTFKEKDLFFRGIISWLGFNKAVIEYEHVQRHSGKTSYNFYRMAKLALAGITGFSTRPLLLSIVVGFLMSLISVIAILYAVYLHYSGNTISGWTSLIIAIMFFGGIQMIFLGVLGIYVGKIFKQVKNRPNYVVD